MGEFDLSNFTNSLRRQLAQNLAARTMTAGMDALGIGQDTVAITTASASGSAMFGSAITAASAAGASMFAAALAGAAIPAAAGGGGVGLLGGIASLFGFAEGGYSDQPGMTTHSVPVAAFRHAPHFAEGTANTSGIPAVLHDNEAVVPLTKGRKIPVDASGLANGGESNVSITHGDIVTNVTIEGGDISDPAQANRFAKSISDSVRLAVDQRLAEQMQYGGMMNPRGQGRRF